jgi:ribonuclease HI
LGGAVTYKFLKCWADGGVLGRNPSARGVYWSVVIEGAPRAVVIRQRSAEYHTNSDSEWLAVREALTWAVKEQLGQPVVIYSDSQCVVKQLTGATNVHVERHLRLYLECRRLAAQLPWVVMKWVPREQIVARVGH